MRLMLAPVNLVPAIRPEPGFPRRLAQYTPPVPAQDAGIQEARKLVGYGMAVTTVTTLFSAGAAWVGYSTGRREDGMLSALGWIVGIGGTLGVLGGLSAMVFASSVNQAIDAKQSP